MSVLFELLIASTLSFLMPSCPTENLPQDTRVELMFLKAQDQPVDLFCISKSC